MEPRRRGAEDPAHGRRPRRHDSELAGDRPQGLASNQGGGSHGEEDGREVQFDERDRHGRGGRVALYDRTVRKVHIPVDVKGRRGAPDPNVSG